jgi:predicted phage terminase large subunit-like protein
MRRTVKAKQEQSSIERLRAATTAACARLGIEPVQSDIQAQPDFPDWLPRVSPKLTWNWRHQLYLYEALARVTRGEVKRMIICMPPRHTKSETVTVRYSAYRLEREPSMRVIIGAYNQRLANKFSRKIRRIVEPRLNLSVDCKKIDEWETPQGGGLLAAGVGSGLTGHGGDLIIIDDPVKSREEAESESYRERCWDWYTDDVSTRLEPGAAVILIQTRWHEDDLAGRLLQAARKGGEQWEVVTLAALAETDDPLGRAEGEALCPERYPREELQGIQARLGARSFAALYQQRPVPAEGGLFKNDWFKRTVELSEVPVGLKWARYYDLAASQKQSADFTASAACAFDKDGTLYIRDVQRGRIEYPEARKLMVKTMCLENLAYKITFGIEEALHGLAAIQDLRREPLLRGIAFRGVRVDKDKKSRALAWATRAEAGKVVLVRGAWINEFMQEVSSFPYGKHDDQVDAVSGAVQMLASGRSRKLVAW